MDWVSLLIEDREINPRESVLITRAPDDVLNIGDASIREKRKSVLHSDHSRHPFDSSLNQVSWLDAYKRRSSVQHLGPKFASKRRIHRQNVVADKSYKAKDQIPRHVRFDRPGNVP